VNKFQNFLESVRAGNPQLVETISAAYSIVLEAREIDIDEQKSYMGAHGKKCMDHMLELVDSHGYWSEPVKLYSVEMDVDGNLSDDERAIIHSSTMNMY
jgi:hypothetical protein